MLAMCFSTTLSDSTRSATQGRVRLAQQLADHLRVERGTAAGDPLTGYTYNGAGNLVSAKNALAAIASVGYNSDGTVKSSTDPKNGTNSTTYAYNSDKLLTTVTRPPATAWRRVPTPSTRSAGP
jgi:YD repeat-containing protein